MTMNRYISLYESQNPYGINPDQWFKVPEAWYVGDDKGFVIGEDLIEWFDSFVHKGVVSVKTVKEDWMEQIEPVGNPLPPELGELPDVLRATWQRPKSSSEEYYD